MQAVERGFRPPPGVEAGWPLPVATKLRGNLIRCPLNCGGGAFAELLHGGMCSARYSLSGEYPDILTVHLHSSHIFRRGLKGTCGTGRKISVDPFPAHRLLASPTHHPRAPSKRGRTRT